MIHLTKKMVLASLLIIASGIFVAGAQNANWKLDKAHSSVNFEVGHLFSTVHANFTQFDGTFLLDPKNLEQAKVSFTIPVISINTGDKSRDAHLQSADFFDAAKYPTISFVSTKIQKKSDKDYIVYGKLTIRDITKEVALPFTLLGEMENPMAKGTRIMGIKLTTKINRNDYGVGTGSWAATAVIGDNVDVTINLELNK